MATGHRAPWVPGTRVEPAGDAYLAFNGKYKSQRPAPQSQIPRKRFYCRRPGCWGRIGRFAQVVGTCPSYRHRQPVTIPFIVRAVGTENLVLPHAQPVVTCSAPYPSHSVLLWAVDSCCGFTYRRRNGDLSPFV